MPDSKEVVMKEAANEADGSEEEEAMDTSNSQGGAVGVIEEKSQESQSASPSANVAAALCRLLVRLNAAKLPKIEEPSVFFRFLGSEIKKSFNGLNRHPKPIGPKAIRLSNEEWKRADAYAQHLTADFCRRAELLVQRLDVTVESFFWSDRVRDMENAINEVYLPQRNALNSWTPIGVADALGATEDLLVLEKASSRRQQVSTRSKITSFTLPTAPKDRGGRMGEIRAPVRESFGRQNRGRGGGHSGHGHGHGRGGGRKGFDQYGKQKDNKVENQVKREYSEQHVGSENQDGNKHSGRAGGHGGHGGRHGKRQRPS